MINKKYNCEDCDTEFSIKYDPDNSESDPQMCPFCGSYIIDDDTLDEDE